ncbi:MAG: superoxide dismutase [Ni] [Planctomycetota bacterium]
MTARHRTLAALLPALALVVWLTPQPAAAHCQVPCGIFGDEMKFQKFAEHIETIEKAMREVRGLEGESGVEAQQEMVRWIINKEEHAELIMDDVQAYFLAQRIKLPEDESQHEAYHAKLAALHAVTIHAMKCKQTLEQANVDALRASLAEFRGLYFDEHDEAHIAGHHDHDHSH